MTFHRDRPHNALPKLPPKAELETKRVLKKLIGARTALAELKETGKLLPNQAVLIQTIGLQEAKLSSEIENVVTTHDALFRALADATKPTDPATKEVLAYKDALWRGYHVVKVERRPLSTPLFEELVGTIKGAAIGVRKVPGTKLANTAGEVIYTPPEGEPRLRELLANLEKFIHADDELDPLVRLAVMHYQFEAIHPFSDGNGRTGRILNILFLVEKGLLDIPVLYLSRYILEHKTDYYRGLRAVTEEGAWERWVLYMLDAVESMARLTRERMLAILELLEQTRALVQEQLPKIYSKDLVEALFRYPYTKISFLEQAKLGNRITVTRYLRELVRIGVLEQSKVGRDLYFLNKPFWRLLEGK
ncbi:MAG TPA: Fic family protein [Thermoleophilia bacterium]|nr:Fic family protein [Thermoleophilia bacterium]